MQVINEYFMLLFVMFAHNRNANDLAKHESEEENNDGEGEQQQIEENSVDSDEGGSSKSLKLKLIEANSSSPKKKVVNKYKRKESLFKKIYNYMVAEEDQELSKKERLDEHTKVTFLNYDCCQYDGGGLYEDAADQTLPEQLTAPSSLQTRLLLLYSDIVNDVVESDNEKLEDLTKIIGKETVVFLAQVFIRVLYYYKQGVLVDDYVKLVFDKKVIMAQLEIRKNYLYPPQNMHPKQMEIENQKQEQVDISDKIREYSLNMIDSLLAITEIFANVTSFGDKADYFKYYLNETGILERCVILMKYLKATTDIMIEHKIYEPDDKFATYALKSR